MASKHHSTREKWNKLLTGTHSSEVDYSLFIMVMVVLVMLERLEKRPGASLAAFPPPIFTATGGMAWLGAHTTWSHLELGGPILYFLSSGCFSCKNIYARKILEQFEFLKVPEMSKNTK
jgi:hypothetical protein